jgi:hypothetical protein
MASPSSFRGICVAACATIGLSGLAAAQRMELPPGPHRELVSRECQACHDLSMVLAATGLTRQGWEGVIDEMTSYGMRVTPEQRAEILDYLANSLGSSSPPAPSTR